MGSEPASAAVSSGDSRGGTAWRGLQLALAATDAVSLRVASSRGREEAARGRLLGRLHEMHGLPEKIAQLMTLGDLSKPGTAALDQESARPPLGVARVHELLREELGGGRPMPDSPIWAPSACPRPWARSIAAPWMTARPSP